MSAVGVLWARAGLETAVALTLLALVSPPLPGGVSEQSVSWLSSLTYLVALAVIARVLLEPRCGHFPPARARRLGRSGFVCLFAANEEIIWRRTALGELLRWGPTAACIATAVVFGLAHRERPALHLATGTVLGVLYLATGALGACICAHWAYNVLVDGREMGSRRLEGIK